SGRVEWTAVSAAHGIPGRSRVVHAGLPARGSHAADRDGRSVDGWAETPIRTRRPIGVRLGPRDARPADSPGTAVISHRALVQHLRIRPGSRVPAPPG